MKEAVSSPKGAGAIRYHRPKKKKMNLDLNHTYYTKLTQMDQRFKCKS